MRLGILYLLLVVSSRGWAQNYNNGQYYGYSNWLAGVANFTEPYVILSGTITNDGIIVFSGGYDITASLIGPGHAENGSWVASMVHNASAGPSLELFFQNAGIVAFDAHWTLDPVVAGLYMGYNFPGQVASPGQSFNGFWGWTAFNVDNTPVIGLGNLLLDSYQDFSMTDVSIVVENPPPSSVPEPQSWALAGAGLLGCFLWRFRGERWHLALKRKLHPARFSEPVLRAIRCCRASQEGRVKA